MLSSKKNKTKKREKDDWFLRVREMLRDGDDVVDWLVIVKNVGEVSKKYKATIYNEEKSAFDIRLPKKKQYKKLITILCPNH